jgi:hypothetical protein
MGAPVYPRATPDVIEEWRALYEQANDKAAPEIEGYQRGWYRVEGFKYRRHDFERMCEGLRQRIEECAKTESSS